MKSNQLPLTETVFYLLIAFSEPIYGYLAIKKIEELSQREVRIAAGTMYGAIENLLKLDMLQQLSSNNERRKIYQTTKYGKQILEAEVLRMQHCINIFDSNNRGEKNEETI
ncbi:PadR family transcriptional regulator [Enterococcus saccharolyticus]|uniref:PadR family transcriptional regulator n=1 Tax=Enterococcus saccharolyticus TaxID=41997 RepID=UPI0039E01CAA